MYFQKIYHNLKENDWKVLFYLFFVAYVQMHWTLLGQYFVGCCDRICKSLMSLHFSHKEFNQIGQCLLTAIFKFTIDCQLNLDLDWLEDDLSPHM